MGIHNTFFLIFYGKLHVLYGKYVISRIYLLGHIKSIHFIKNWINIRLYQRETLFINIEIILKTSFNTKIYNLRKLKIIDVFKGIDSLIFAFFSKNAKEESPCIS